MKLGNTLGTGGFLRQGDYLTSLNGLFHVIMQTDGNLVVYHGSGPDNQIGNAVWASNTFTTPCFLVVNGDGNLCIYKGTGPNDNQGFVWGLNGQNRQPFDEKLNWGTVAVMQEDGNFVVYTPHGVMWGDDVVPVISSFEALLTYDLASRKITDTNSPDQVPLEVDNYNDSDVTQTRILTFQKGTTKTASWSATNSIKVGVSAKFGGGIPAIGISEVTISSEFSHSYTWGETESTQDSISAQIPVTAGPFEAVKCTALLMKRIYEIPYSGTATFHYEDGASASGPISGAYTGALYYLMSNTTSSPIPH